MRKLFAGLATVIAVAACQENITTPGDCPTLCPGEQIIVRDTTILAIAGSDSAFFGYFPRASNTVLLVSSGLAAGELRSFLVFPKQRRDSIQVDGTQRALIVDTISISFSLQARDSTAKNLMLFLHRVPITVDTAITFDSLQVLIAGAPAFDSIAVADTVKLGKIEALFVGPRLALIDGPEADSGRFALGLTVRADKPTGVRLGGGSGLTSGPLFETRGKVDVSDTAKQRQRTSVRPDAADKLGYVGNRDLAVGADPDLLYIGGPQAARSILRFAIPKFILDSSQILRATLELTPAARLDGLPNNPGGDSLAVRGVAADLGAKSPPLGAAGLLVKGGLGQGTTNATQVDMFSLVSQWQVAGGPPPVVFIAHLDEPLGGGFMQPVFYSTRSPTGQPRLRLTYGLPTRPGRP